MASYPTPPPTGSPNLSSKPTAEEPYFLDGAETRSSSPRQGTSPPSHTPKSRAGSRAGSPVHRVSSPYSAHGQRAKPRRAFVGRMVAKLRRFLGAVAAFEKKIPITLGLLTMLPVIAGAALFRVGKGLVNLARGKSAEPNLGLGKSKVLDSFKSLDGLTGHRAGPLSGIFKILQMLMDHLHRITGRAV